MVTCHKLAWFLARERVDAELMGNVLEPYHKLTNTKSEAHNSVCYSLQLEDAWLFWLLLLLACRKDWIAAIEQYSLGWISAVLIRGDGRDVR